MHCKGGLLGWTWNPFITACGIFFFKYVEKQLKPIVIMWACFPFKPVIPGYWEKKFASTRIQNKVHLCVFRRIMRTREKSFFVLLKAFTLTWNFATLNLLLVSVKLKVGFS